MAVTDNRQQQRHPKCVTDIVLCRLVWANPLGKEGRVLQPWAPARQCPAVLVHITAVLSQAGVYTAEAHTPGGGFLL